MCVLSDAEPKHTIHFSVTIGQADSGYYVSDMSWSQNTPFFSVTVGQADSGDYVCRTCHGARTHHSLASLSVRQTVETMCVGHGARTHHSLALLSVRQTVETMCVGHVMEPEHTIL